MYNNLGMMNVDTKSYLKTEHYEKVLHYYKTQLNNLMGLFGKIPMEDFNNKLQKLKKAHLDFVTNPQKHCNHPQPKEQILYTKEGKIKYIYCENCLLELRSEKINSKKDKK